MRSMPELSDLKRRKVKRAGGILSLFSATLAVFLAYHSSATAQPAAITTGSPQMAEALRPDSLHRLVAPELMARLVELAGHKLRDAAIGPEGPQLMVEVGGLVYGIVFYQCGTAPATQGLPPDAAADAAADAATTAPGCASLRFEAAFRLDGGMTLEQANGWNRDRRFGRLWLDADGDPHLEMDVSLAGGVATAYLVEVLDWWTLVLEDFRRLLYGQGVQQGGAG